MAVLRPGIRIPAAQLLCQVERYSGGLCQPQSVMGDPKFPGSLRHVNRIPARLAVTPRDRPDEDNEPTGLHVSDGDSMTKTTCSKSFPRD